MIRVCRTIQKALVGIGIVVLGTLAMPAFAGSGTDSTSGTFITTNQSLWSAGSASSLAFSKSVGPAGSFGVTLGGISQTCCGSYGVQASISGSAGMQLDFSGSLNHGTVSANIPFNSTISYLDQASPGSIVVPTVTLGFGNSSFLANMPGITAGTSIQSWLNASYGATGCLVGCASTGGSLMNVSANIPLSSTNQSNNIQIQANGSSGVKQTLTSSGSTTFGISNVNISQTIANAFGLPLSGNIGPLSFNLVSADAGLQATLNQQLGLDPTLFADLYVVQTGQNVLCNGKGCKEGINIPKNFQGQLTIDPTYYLNAQFGNITSLTVDPYLQMSMLSGSINVFGTNLGSFGPVLTAGGNLASLDIPVYKGYFNLQGFNTIEGNPFHIEVAQSTPVPEPATLGLMGMSLIAATIVARRRRLT